MSRRMSKSAMVAGAGLLASIFTGLCKAVHKAGGTDEDIHRLSTPEGEEILARVAEVIVGTSRQTFKVWKTIKLGTGLKTADDFREAIKDSGMQISNWASDILGKSAFKAADKETEIDLVVLTTAELTGKKEGGTTAEVFAGAKRLGLEKCPAEVGPQLMLQDKGQPMDKRLLISMEPITASGGHLGVFYVERGAGRWLDCWRCGSPGLFWPSEDQWVFCLPRK